MWNKTEFEKHLEERLLAEFNSNKAESMFAAYVTSRDKLLRDVFGYIQGVEPDLSDHGADHIEHVFKNATSLISVDQSIHGFSATTLYCLGMAILFHDVGNLFGRTDHHKKIAEVFDWARGTDASVRREKTLILRIARAHTGTAADGTYDTLKEINELDQLGSANVRPRDVASILRFADELAEGQRRTSEFKRINDLIAADSRIYHDYASVTNILADRGTERILVTYEIAVDEFPESDSEDHASKLRRLLQFIYVRAIKLDQERRYAKFYCNALSPFKTTQVVLNFHCNGQILELDLPPLQLDDKTIPGDPARTIPELDTRYTIEPLVAKVFALAEGAN